MKIDIEFTHWGFFYGLPIYAAFQGNGVFPIPIIPLTGFWITAGVPVIQYLRELVIVALNIDSLERGSFVVERCRPLKKPFVKSFDWPESACREYRNGGTK